MVYVKTVIRKHGELHLYILHFSSFCYLFPPSLSPSVCFQGLDEEAIVDHGKASFTTHTNYEKEDLESKFKATKTEIFFL